MSQQKNASPIFPATCPNCSHVNQFDKNIVCSADAHDPIYRGDKKTKQNTPAMLSLPCENCQKRFVLSVDCEGYR